MYNKHHTKGIILKNFEHGDSSNKVLILSKDFGLIYAKVQSGRSMSSRFRYSTQNYSIGMYSVVKGKSEWKLVSALAESNIYEDFKNNFEKLKISTNVLNLIKKLSGEEQLNKKLFTVVLNFLEYLKKAKNDKLPLVECLVLLKILNIFGYMRNDPDFSIPIYSLEMIEEDIETIAPNRAKVVKLINESLKMSNLM